MDYNNLAKTLLDLVGEKDNVQTLTHCATRLRFNLNNNAKAKKDELKALDGVLGVVESGGQFQVIIGNHVSHVYKELVSLLGHVADDSAATADSKNNSQETLTSRIFGVISGSFTPLIGALAGSGMIKALLAVLTMLEWLDASSTTYSVLSAAANAVFYFLPVLLGISAAIKMGANGYIGGAIGAALLEPNFTGLIGNADATFFGLPLVAINYSSSVFPIFIAVALLSVVERYLKKICPDNMQMFLVPMLSLLLIVPLTVLFFGPFGVNLGNVIADGINWLSAHSGILTGAVIGGSMMFLVVFGLHWGIVPIIVANIGLGGDPIGAMWAPCTFAQMGVAMAFWVRSKDSSIKSIAGPATMSGLLAGVTEPIIYGLIMRFRRTIPIVVIAGVVGGAIEGLFQTKITAFAFHSVLAIPVFQPVVPYTIGIATGFGIAFVLTMLFVVGREESPKAAAVKVS